MRLHLPPAGYLQVSFERSIVPFSQAHEFSSRFWTWDGAEQCFLKDKYLTTVPVDNHVSGTKDCSMGETLTESPKNSQVAKTPTNVRGGVTRPRNCLLGERCTWTGEGRPDHILTLQRCATRTGARQTAAGRSGASSRPARSPALPRAVPGAAPRVGSAGATPLPRPTGDSSAWAARSISRKGFTQI